MLVRQKVPIKTLKFVVETSLPALKLCPPIRCGVALDAWMVPLDDEIFPRVKQPIFFINSEKFQWAGNISRMKKLDCTVIDRKMITIRYRADTQ